MDSLIIDIGILSYPAALVNFKLREQWQRNVQKSVLQVQSCFLLIRLNVFCFAFLAADAVWHYTISCL